MEQTFNPEQPFNDFQNQQQQPYEPKPDNYLVWAILTTICCCLPFGIVSIVYAAKVNVLYVSGQYAAARKASADAKQWAIIAAIVGAIINVIYGIFYACCGMASVLGASL